MAAKRRIRVPRPNLGGSTAGRTDARTGAARAPGAGRRASRPSMAGRSGQAQTGNLMRDAIEGARNAAEEARLEREYQAEMTRRAQMQAEWDAEDAAAMANQASAAGPGLTKQIQPGKPVDSSPKPITARLPAGANVPTARNVRRVQPKPAPAPKQAAPKQASGGSKSISVPKARPRRSAYRAR